MLGPAQRHRFAVVVLGAVMALAPLVQTIAAPAEAPTTREDTPFPFFAGDEGTHDISDSRSQATLTVDAPTVWNEHVLWGCKPDGSCVLSQAGDGEWIPYQDGLAFVDAADYDPKPAFFLEAVVDAGDVDEVKVRLADAWTGEVVPDSTISTTESSPTRIRSNPFTLDGAGDYRFDVRVDDGSSDSDTADVYTVKLLSAQTGAQDTVTTARVSGADLVPPGNRDSSDRSAIWRYDAEAFDGNLDVRFEAVASLPGGDGDVQLVRTSDGQVVTTLNFDGGDTKTRLRSTNIAGSITPGEEYEVRARNNALGTFSLHLARIVVHQEGLDRTLRYVDLSWQDTTTSKSFEDAGYPALHHGSTEWGPTWGYLEATMHTQLIDERLGPPAAFLGSSASARLTNASAEGTPVTGSAIETTDTSPTRVRTDAALALNRSDTVYRVQAASSSHLAKAEIRNAWLLGYQDGGRTFDHVLENEHRASGEWDVTLDATGSENLGRVENMTIGIREGDTTDVTARLPTPRERVASIWDPVREVAYLFGGQGPGARLAEILAYDPANDTAWNVASLPTAREGATAVWDPGREVAYVFGGEDASGDLADIVAFDPSNNTAWVKAHLPTPRNELGGGSVWDPVEDVAYVFGGDEGPGTELDEIVAYDPSNNTAWARSTLPSPRDDTSAVWDPNDDVAYVFGGFDETAADESEEIVIYDPAANTATTGPSKLPTPRQETGAAWDPVDDVAYVFGGLHEEGPEIDQVVEFDPASGSVRNVAASLPSERQRMGGGAMWDPIREEAYVFGGHEGDTPIDEIAHYGPRGTLQIQVDEGTLHETPTPLRWDGERNFQHVVHADVEGAGPTAIEADLVATNVDSGETVRQAAEYVVSG